MIQYCYTIWQLVKSNRKPHIRSSKYFPELKTADNCFVCYLVSCSSRCPLRGWGGARRPSRCWTPRASGSSALTVSTEASLALTSDLCSKLLLAAFLSRQWSPSSSAVCCLVAVLIHRLRGSRGAQLSAAQVQGPRGPRGPETAAEGPARRGRALLDGGGPRWTGPRWT